MINLLEWFNFLRYGENLFNLEIINERLPTKSVKYTVTETGNLLPGFTKGLEKKVGAMYVEKGNMSEILQGMDDGTRVEFHYESNRAVDYIHKEGSKLFFSDVRMYYSRRIKNKKEESHYNKIIGNKIHKKMKRLFRLDIAIW